MAEEEEEVGGAGCGRVELVGATDETGLCREWGRISPVVAD